MMPIRNFAPPRLVLQSLLCASLLAGSTLSAALVAPDGLSLRTLEEYSTTGIPEDQWPALLEALGRTDQSTAVHSLIKAQSPFPRAKLVELLTHQKLAIRLGALDLLEEAAGETFDFDPFQEDPAAGNNTAALARWKTWSGSGSGGSGGAGGAGSGGSGGATAAGAAIAVRNLTDETFRTIAMEIMAEDRGRAERAMQRLDGFGLAAVARFEAFFAAQPDLAAGPKAALKAAEYRVVLLQFLPRQGAALARDLSLGTLEAQSVALAALGKAGPGVLPVIAEFLTSPDPLVRETAVDAAFEAGKENAAGLMVERLKTETTESVLHAMLRGLGEHGKTAAHTAAVVPFLKHASENVVVSALEALGANSQGSYSAELVEALKDPRWRVRAAALETIGKRKLVPLSADIQKHFEDRDLYVRVSAIEALQAALDEQAPAILSKQFALHDELKAPILRSLFKGRKAPPAELWQDLLKAPPEVILQGLETLEDRDDYSGKRIPLAAPFASHPNRDVAASALRLLASRGRFSGLLLNALNGADSVKADAVLDALVLPPASLLPAKPAVDSPAPAKGSSVLERLYQVFGKTGTAPAGGNTTGSGGAAAPATDELQAAPEAMRTTLERFLRQGSPRQRFRAAVVLAGQNDLPAIEFLLAGYDTFNDLDRRMLTLPLQQLPGWPPGPTLDLATRLLRDNANEVREQAIKLWMGSSHLPGLLAELLRPGSHLQPDDLYSWELDRACESASQVILEWARPVLANPEAAASNQVLAIVLLARTGQKELLTPFLDSPNPWLRRAAYRALGLAAADSHLQEWLRDESAMVRAALPFAASPHNGGWRHWFDDAHTVDDSEDLERQTFSSGREFGAWAQKPSKAAVISPAILAALEKLTRDPSEIVRFETLFALLRLSQPVDPAALASLLSVQPEEAQARSRVGNFFEKNFARLGPGFSVLVPILSEIDEREMTKILQHFGMQKESALTSFAALAQLVPNAGPSPASALATAPAPVIPAAREAFRVLFFFKAGCRDCQRVREMLNQHAADFPRMLIEEHDIDEPREILLSGALSQRFGLKENLQLATPALFTQGGTLIREQITFPKLGDLLRKTSALRAEPDWARVETRQIATAEQSVRQRYATLSFGVIATAGLLDGINPCAFATVIFLLSYLQVARRSPREILAVGAAFILAVFLTYFAVGLGLAQVLTRLSAFRSAGALLSQLLAAFALVVAVLSFRDARLAARGQLSSMTLQLPGVLKSQIRTVIREGSRATRFVCAAFAAGVVISLLELACTGQVYLPTILYMVKSGESGALRHLLLYNLAFIVPLIVVFGLAWGGMRSEALIRFQTQRTTLLKTLTGVLFVMLAAFLLFGHLLR